jgi:hypothetical protein
MQAKNKSKDDKLFYRIKEYCDVEFGSLLQWCEILIKFKKKLTKHPKGFPLVAVRIHVTHAPYLFGGNTMLVTNVWVKQFSRGHVPKINK